MILMPAGDLFTLGFDLGIRGKHGISLVFLDQQLLGAKLILKGTQLFRRQIRHPNPSFLLLHDSCGRSDIKIRPL